MGKWKRVTRPPRSDSDLIDFARQQARAVKSSGEATLKLGADRDRELFEGPPADSFTGYQILKEAHRGGQGVVYQAIQESTRRKVAIKVMREGPFADSTDRARFEREVHVLGQLSHPHIVTIHDSGSAAGHFYFVMDYIPGQTLDVHMAGGDHSIDDTLQLFGKICEAVNAAHLRGVIHRDLKPSNIRIDYDGEPHILDFGLAKVATPLSPPLEGGDGGGVAAMTLTGQFVGSLPWASPEQAEGVPGKIDVRTDVYSLGVILYQMLTGKFPYDVMGNMRDVLDNIMAAEPARPSTIGWHGRPGRGINDEVDTIVLKCLAKEPERRYQTGGELGRDVQHYLSGEPIEAKRDSGWYVLKKMLRRYRVPTAVAAVFVMVIAGGLLTSVVYWQQASAERDRAVLAEQEQSRERQRAEEALILAEQRQQETQQVADFQSGMFREIDVEAMGRGIKEHFREQVRAALERQYVGEYPNRRKRTAEEIEAELAAYDERAAAAQAVDVARRVMDEYVLKRAAEELHKQFGAQPLVQAQIQNAIGTTYTALGLYDAAEPYLRAALHLHQDELGPEHESVAASLTDLAELLRAKGHYDAAEPLFREALALCRKLFGDEHRDVATGMNNLALLLDDKGDYATAEPLHREALALRRKLLGDEHPAVADSLNNLAKLLWDKGDHAAAEPLYREALALSRKLRGDEHPQVAGILNNLANVLTFKGDYGAAEPVLREALALRRELFGDEHPDVAQSLENLGTLLRAKGDYSAAEPLLREALTLYRDLLGDEHPRLTISLNNLAELLRAKGEYAAAEPLYREALERQRRMLGEEHPDTLIAINNMGLLLRSQGRLAEAEAYFRDGLPRSRRVLGDEHPTTLILLSNMGEVLAAQGKLAEAEPYYRDALEALRRRLGDEHVYTLQAINNMGHLLRSQRKLAEAEAYFRDALKGCRQMLGDDHPNTLVSINNMAVLLRDLGRLEEAEALGAEAVRGARAKLVPSHPLRLTMLGQHGRTLTAMQRFTEAESELLETYEDSVQTRGEEDERTTFTIKSLGELYDTWHAAEPDQGYDAKAAEWRAKLPPAELAGYLITRAGKLIEQGKHAEAEPMLRECLQIRQELLDEGHWLIFNTMSVLGESLAGQGADGSLSVAARIENLREAELLLLEGYEGLKDDPDAPDERKREALERIIKLYEAWHAAEPDKGYDVKAAEWRAKLLPP